MDRNNPLDVEWNIEQALEHKKLKPKPQPEPEATHRTWQQIMDERLYTGGGRR